MNKKSNANLTLSVRRVHIDDCGTFKTVLDVPYVRLKMSARTVVVNMREEDFEVYIGRPSKWGNPFVIGKDGTRKEVIAKYREYIMARKDLLDSLNELEGKRLGCFCAPLACHGDVLVELVSKLR